MSCHYQLSLHQKYAFLVMLMKDSLPKVAKNNIAQDMKA